MQSYHAKEPQHRNDAEFSNSMKLNSAKQAAYKFALAKHLSVCHPPENTSLANELCRLVASYDDCKDIPSTTLTKQLSEYTKHKSDVFDKDAKAYIFSCVERYQRGIPIHIGRLLKCQSRIERFKADHDELLELGLICIDQNQEITIEDPTPHLLPSEWSKWPKSKNGSLSVEREQLQHAPVALAQKLYRALSFYRYRSLLRFNVNHRGMHFDYPNPFAASSGREAPKGGSFIYLPKDARHYLLKPPKGKKIITLDWCSQEPASLAALAGDKELWNAYLKGDLYTELQRRSKLFSDLDRKQFKVLCISHLYGCTPHGIAKKFRVTPTVATVWDNELKHIFFKVNQYLDHKVNEARSLGYAEVIGFKRTITANTKHTSIRNFFVQAICARMLRLLCIKLNQLHIPLLFAIHDAIGIEADIDDMNTEIMAKQAMADVSESVLGPGFQLLSEREDEVSTPH
ncbi:DNA polymerase [Vibrio sp. PNB23_22_6]